MTILNSRRTPMTSQDKMSSYLKEGLLLSHGRGLGLKSRTRTRKTYFVKYDANRSPHQTQTPPTYFTTYERIINIFENQPKKCFLFTFLYLYIHILYFVACIICTKVLNKRRKIIMSKLSLFVEYIIQNVI